MKKPLYHLIKHRAKELDFNRNFLCAEYDACLTAAARDDCYLDCSQCALRDSKKDSFVLSHGEINGCFSLLSMVFCQR
jgi:hypothetical protein